MQTPRRFLIGSVVAVGLVVCGAPWGAVRVASAQDQTLFIAFTGADGTPVTDMTAEEIIIQWDEMLCEIREIEPINWPVRVTVFVDNATESQTVLPDMREGLTGFLEALPPDIEVAIATIAGRPQFLNGPHRPTGVRSPTRSAKIALPRRRRDLLRCAVRRSREAG